MSTITSPQLVVFDTFSGLKGVEAKDGSDSQAVEGASSSGTGYEHHLERVLFHHEAEASISHIKLFEVVKGEATKTIGTYLQSHPETIVAMAYFDMDIYAPTLACLNALKPHLTRAPVLAFDELNCPEYPGETMALAEAFGLGRCRLLRSPLTPWMSFTTGENIVG